MLPANEDNPFTYPWQVVGYALGFLPFSGNATITFLGIQIVNGEVLINLHAQLQEIFSDCITSKYNLVYGMSKVFYQLKINTTIFTNVS